MVIGRDDIKNSFEKEWKISVVLTLIIILTYASLIIISYGFADDYYFLWRSKININIMNDNVAAGRPIMGFLLQTGFSLVPSLSKVKYLRVVTILGISFLAILLFRVFHANGLTKYFASLLALAVIFTHPFQVYVAWSQYFVGPLACLLGTIAANIVYRTDKKEKLPQRYIRLSAGAIIFLLALMTYQPGAMFYWVIIGVYWLGERGNLEKNGRKLINVVVVAIISLLFDFLSLHIVTEWMNLPIDSRAKITIDPIAKINWFIQEPIIDALNFVNIQPSETFGIIIALIIIFGLYLYFTGNMVEKLLRLFTTILFIPLTYLPSLISIDSWASYRTKSALSALLIIYLFFSIKGFLSFFSKKWHFPKERVQKIMLSSVVLILAFFAANNVLNYFAVPQVKEFSILRSKLVQIDFENISSIWIIRPNWSQGVNSLVRYDEFGKPNLYHEWAVEPMVRLALEEIGYSDLDITISSLAYNEDVPIPPSNAKLIDMRELQYLR